MNTDALVIVLSNIGTGVLALLLSIPLLLRQVPMNGIYGIRVAKAFRSQEDWYRINTFGGKVMSIWAIVLILGALLAFVVPVLASPVVQVGILVGSMILLVLVPIVWYTSTLQ